ncbi:monocarboxylate transporter 13 [Periophthalmus magnuspinnatus]|uniref:monocarboxylate transporter 13 n=1 Tax=Periophthalmus magnuspinnatus TaxID=409849 RepID=UPI002436B25C|nr:monocarboxylate transporter 13 [Periophthalmus magnuspinnatus]
MTQKQMKASPVEGPDGGWGWVLVAALFVCNTLVFGLMRVFGIFFVEFVHYFGESAQAISWISSIGVATQQFFSTVGAALGNAYGARVVVMAGGFLTGLGLILASQATAVFHLYLTMGVITGLGWGLVFAPMMATVMAHFTRRRTMALGLSLSSIGLSAFAYNPLFQLLIESYTWRGALLIAGALAFNIIPCGALIGPQKHSVPAEKTNSDNKVSQSMLQRVSSYMALSVLLERPYITLVLATSFMNAGFFVPYIHLVALGRGARFSDYQAAFLVSSAGIADIVGRLFSGWFTDLGYFRMIHVLTTWAMLLGLSIALLPVSTLTGSYLVVTVASVLYGFCSGALTALPFSILPQIVGVGRVMGALGLLQMLESGAGLLGTPLSGYLRDITGEFFISFLVAGSFLLVAGLILTTQPHFFSRTDPPLPLKHPLDL